MHMLCVSLIYIIGKIMFENIYFNGDSNGRTDKWSRNWFLKGELLFSLKVKG